VPPFTAYELTPVNQGRSRLGVSALIALTTPSLPDAVRPTKVGLTGEGHADRTRWIHVAPTGHWAGHGEGAFELTADHFASIKTTLDRKATPCSLDYEHASIRPKGPATPAAGYVQATHVRDDGLWACVEFTKEAWGLIESGSYRFCSGVFDFSSVDAVTGEPVLCTLDTIALTNRPFIDGQHPIALSRAVPPSLVPLSAGAPKMKIQKKALDKLMDALGLSKEFTAAQLTKALEFLTAGEDAPEEVAEVADAAKADASKTPPGTTVINFQPPVVTATKVAASADVAPASAEKPADSAECAPPADATATAEDLPTEPEAAPADPFAKLAEAVGVDAAGLAEKIMANFDAVVSLLMGSGEAAMSAALTKDLAVGALKSQVTELQRKLNVYETAEKAALSKALEAEVDTLVKTGRLHPAAKAQTLALARTNPKGFRDLAAVLQPTLPLGAHASAIAPAPGGGEALDQDGHLPVTHPRVVALSKALDDMKVKPEAKAAALKKLTGV
jgi:phage I-like protein